MQRKYWGKGLGTELAIAMVVFGFTDVNTTALVAVTTFENIASQHVLQNAGLQRMENIIKDGLELAYFEIKRVQPADDL